MQSMDIFYEIVWNEIREYRSRHLRIYPKNYPLFPVSNVIALVVNTFRKTLLYSRCVNSIDRLYTTDGKGNMSSFDKW